MNTKATDKRNVAVDALLRTLEAHPQRALLIKSGKQRDDLLRALIPLFLLDSGYAHVVGRKVEITGGVTSVFWKLHGVKIQGPRAARALREHIGFARFTKEGRRITPAGDRYVKSELERLKQAKERARG